jgi:rhodanese-related sulfurtransferase
MNVAQTVRSVADMVKEARAQIENLAPAEVKGEMENGNIIIIDIREPDEVNQNGAISGSISAPRGMLEFYADASLPYHKPEFKKNSRLILQCASGGRTLMAASKPGRKPVCL